MTDENITWDDDIQTAEKNLQKSLGLLYRANHLLDNDSLWTIYFSYIHSYLNYVNTAWGNTCFNKLKAMHYQQKHAALVIKKNQISLLDTENAIWIAIFVNLNKQSYTFGASW